VWSKGRLVGSVAEKVKAPFLLWPYDDYLWLVASNKQQIQW